MRSRPCPGPSDPPRRWLPGAVGVVLATVGSLFSPAGAGPRAVAQDAVARDDVEPPAEVRVIRKLDRIVRKEGAPILGTIADPTELDRTGSLRVRTSRSVMITLPAAQIREIIPRQSAEDVYKAWAGKWLRAIGDVSRRARAEYRLGLWCGLPHPDLDGKPPRPDRAELHLEHAVLLDPSLTEAYPWLVAAYARSGPVEEIPDERVDREVGIYLRARSAGYDHPALDARLGSLLASRLGLVEESVPYFQAVLAAREATAGQRRVAREWLSEARLEAGDPDGALALWEPLFVEGREPGFETLYRVATLCLRAGGAERRARARQLLEKARSARPDWPGTLLQLAALEFVEGNRSASAKQLSAYLSRRKDDALARVDQALIRVLVGKDREAEKVLRASIEKGDDRLRGAAEEVLGFLLEGRGDLAGAVAAYREAVRLGPHGPGARLSLASLLARTGRESDARQELDGLLGADPRRDDVRAAVSRVLGTIEAAAGKGEEALDHLAYAVDVEPEDAALLERAARIALGTGRLEIAERYLLAAEEKSPGRPGVLDELAWLRYRQGKIDEAAGLFRKTRDVVRRVSGERRRAVDAYRLHAEECLSRIRDLQDLEMWFDGFEGEDGPEIDGWEKAELYGISVSRRSGRVVFSGTQKNDAAGETSLWFMRPVDGRRFERASLRLRIVSGRARPAFRIETPPDPRRGSAAIMIVRDLDGKVELRIKTARGVWEEPEPSKPEASTGRSLRARLEYAGGVAWPGDGELHTLEIRRSSASAVAARSSRFDLYVDEQAVAKNVPVPGLSGPALRIGVHATTDSTGRQYEFEVDDFKVYRKARAR